jgi:hypothetical protein
MDTGLRYRSLEDELAELPDIDGPEKVTKLIDMLIAREMSWHTGPMLIQTVLSCVYVEYILSKYTEISQSGPPGDVAAYMEEHVKQAAEVDSWKGVFTAYVLGLAKSISLSIALMDPGVAAIYPEEDIVPISSLSLLEDASIESVTRCIEAAARWCGIQKQSDVATRLLFRAEWLYILKQRVPRKMVHIEKALDLLRKTDQVSIAEDEPLNRAFSDGIQTRANYASPMRQLQSFAIDKAYEQFEWIVDSIGGLSKVHQLETSTDLLGFFVMFAARRPRPIPIIRAFLKSAMGPTHLLGQSFKSWVTKDIKALSGAGFSFLDSPKPKMKALLEPFMHQAAQCYADLFTIMCQNRPRQRQNLSHAVVSWDSLQVVADDLAKELGALEDVPPYQTPNGDVFVDPISLWVYIRKVFIMVWVVLMGFELNIYKHWEYCRMYYTAEVLLESIEQRLYAISAHLETKRLQRSHSYTYVSSLRHECSMFRLLCSANGNVGLALDKLGLTRLPPASATSPELLYALRMKPFSSVGFPEVPSYERYKEYVRSAPLVTSTGKMIKQLSSQACSLIDAGLRSLKGNNELELLKRSALAITVSALDVGKAASVSDKSAFEIEEQTAGVHWYFPVLRPKKRTSSS